LATLVFVARDHLRDPARHFASRLIAEDALESAL
jgi:hypothetical protein